MAKQFVSIYSRWHNFRVNNSIRNRGASLGPTGILYPISWPRTVSTQFKTS